MVEILFFQNRALENSTEGKMQDKDDMSSLHSESLYFSRNLDALKPCLLLACILRLQLTSIKGQPHLMLARLYALQNSLL